MRNFKRTIAGLAAIALSLSLAACGDSGDSGSGSNNNAGGGDGGAATEAPKETQATSEATTVTLSQEDEEALGGAMDMLKDDELENKVVKWLAHYDVNPAEGQTVPTALGMFQSKYDAKVQWYPTTWEGRYTDLSTYVLGGEGIDLFPLDDQALPKGVISGMFQAVDEYIDVNDDLWSEVKMPMEVFNFNGKHYAFAVGASANNCVYYNKQTIEENGFEDPWELYESGQWNWDTFTSMLQDFCDASEDNEGLDGWWSELALYRSGGVPLIQTKDGEIIVNMMSPEIEKAQNFMYDLFNKGLVMDKAIYEWSEQPQFMGEGRELFFICGLWHIQKPSADWSTKIPPEYVGVVPVPNAADAEHPWQDAVIDGYCLVKGAANPIGAAYYSECQIAGAKDPDAKEVYNQRCRTEYDWSDEIIERFAEINELALQYPVVDIAGGMSSDIESLTTSNQNKSVGLNASLHGVDWAVTRDELSAPLQVLVDEVKEQLASMQ